MIWRKILDMSIWDVLKLTQQWYGRMKHSFWTSRHYVSVCLCNVFYVLVLFHFHLLSVCVDCVDWCFLNQKYPMPIEAFHWGHRHVWGFFQGIMFFFFLVVLLFLTLAIFCHLAFFGLSVKNMVRISLLGALWLASPKKVDATCSCKAFSHYKEGCRRCHLPSVLSTRLRWAPWMVPEKRWERMKLMHGCGRSSPRNTLWIMENLGVMVWVVLFGDLQMNDMTPGGQGMSNFMWWWQVHESTMIINWW